MRYATRMPPNVPRLILVGVALAIAFTIGEFSTGAKVRERPEPADSAVGCNGTRLAAWTGPRWDQRVSTDGKKNGFIIGVSHERGGGHAIYAVDPAEGRLLRRSPVIPDFFHDLSVSPDGHRALLSSGRSLPDFQDEIRLIDLRNGLVDRVDVFAPHSVSGLAWAPDSAAYSILAQGRLLRGGVDSAELRKITNASNSSFGELAWSSTGDWIAFVNEGFAFDTYRSEITLIHPDGSDRHVLSEGVRGTIAWFPDGTRIAFSNGLGMSIATPEGDDVRHVTLTPAGTAEAGVSWSPDGRYLGFASSDHLTDLQPCLLSADGDLRLRARCGAEYVSTQQKITWSPDAQWLVVPSSRSCDESSPVLRLLAVEGTDIGRPLPYVLAAQWAPAE